MENIGYVIPSAFDPRHSIIGRFLSSRLNDALRAEVGLVGIMAAAVLLLTAALNTTWMLYPEWRSFSILTPDGAAIAFVSVLALVTLPLGLIGWTPVITVTFEPDGISVRFRATGYAFQYADLHGAEIIPALLFHRHYRRYRQTYAFVNRVHGSVLLVWYQRTPLVLGLPEHQHHRFLSTLQKHLDDVSAKDSITSPSYIDKLIIRDAPDS